MNEETVLPTPSASDLPSEPAATVGESLPAALGNPTVEQTEYMEVPQETEAVVLVDVIQTAATDLAHVNLFGSFLICGTLVGIFLLRNRHAN